MHILSLDAAAPFSGVRPGVKLAEREGFEPSVRFHVHTLSKRAP